VTTALYLYALLGTRPPRGRWRGLRNEPLRFRRIGSVVVAAGSLAAAPAPSAPALRRHDAVVRRLARAVPAVLPVRFGTAVADARTLERLIASRAPALRRALAHVKGREQMTLRLFGTGEPVAPRAAARRSAQGGPGTRYLAARHRPWRRAAPMVARLRVGLEGLIRDERVEPSEAPPLLASVYHLVDRGQTRAYRRAVKEIACRLDDIRVVSSGPWAPYAFAPEPGD
jgi:Gas vesicle synthesis protein GvpL/GvpF